MRGRTTRLWWLAALVVIASIVAIGRSLPRKMAAATPLATSRAQLRFVAIDGGPHYFATKSPLSAWMDGRILLGAWDEQPQSLTDVRRDVAMGDNIYWDLSGGSVDYNVIRQGGMHISAPSEDSNTGSETVSWNGDDEPDMRLGPGSAGERITDSSEACTTGGTQCGYTDVKWYDGGDAANISGGARLPYTPDGRVVHTGFGKGVLFWESNAQAARFLPYSGILSADSYWLTDNDLQTASTGGCALQPHNPTICRGGSGTGLDYQQSHLPANYAYNVTRLRSLDALDGGSTPIVVDVETGCPGEGDNAGNCATPPETIAAAWHALIPGARGIVWFQHNFSGACVDFRTFLDGSNPASRMYNCQQTPGVTLHDVVRAVSGFNHEVDALSRVLLAPTAVNYARTTADVSTMAKAYGGVCYVFAASGRPAEPPAPDAAARFTLAGGYTGTVSVFGEHRALYARRGTFTDRFANENAVHIYEIPDWSLCRTP